MAEDLVKEEVVRDVHEENPKKQDDVVDEKEPAVVVDNGKPSVVVVENVAVVVDQREEFSEHEKKALAELKLLIQNALDNHEFSDSPQPEVAVVEVQETKTETQEEFVIEPVVAVTSETQEDEKVIEEETTKEEKEPQEEVKKVNIEEEEGGAKTVEAIEETVVSSSPPPSKEEEKTTAEDKETTTATTDDVVDVVVSAPRPPEEVSIWGVPLMKDERTDTILWKFLQARDFRVKDAFAMIKNTLRWRREFGIDDLVNNDQVADHKHLAKTSFMHGVSKQGNPVCYNVYGAFQDKELYQKAFSDEEKRQNFLKWRIQFLERSIRKLDFSPGGISTIVQVNDLKNSPGPSKWELRQATKQALHLLQDNYPEFVAKQVFINVPWWYMAMNTMISPFLTQRTKSKFVAAGPPKSAETLFNYIAPEQVPVQYGGLSKEGEFGTKDGATQIIVKPTSKETVEFAVSEACHLTWEVRVLGWEVSYGAEFVPNAKESYTVIIQKTRKVKANEETIITNSFKTSEPGKVLLTIDNTSSKKKRLLYRLKSKSSELN